ncbi:MAG: phosphoribulokinase [Gammaproteobacteria bacterium]|nr:phosphoribulokinase [Gammaproteobacteria bacterium]
MSARHPIVAVTGSSGAGTSSTMAVFERIFRRLQVRAAVIEGDSFHRYDRNRMALEVEAALKRGEELTHFGPSGNLFEELERLFRTYSATGSGRRRHYVHTESDAVHYGLPPGTLTDWEQLPPDTELLFYEGLHGGLKTDDHDIARHVDLLVGVVPIINLEWIQKIHRDRSVRGYSAEDATQAILRRMSDYVHYICPQYSRTDVNFQRIPLVDTSNPFHAPAIPSSQESMLVVHINNQSKMQTDFNALKSKISGAFMSAPDTIVAPAEYYNLMVDVICSPVIERLLASRRDAQLEKIVSI